MYKIVLMRHGQSTWNLANRFTGWTDVDLTSQGIAEARYAGEVLRGAGFTFDVAYTSVLKRAIRTLWLALDEMNLMWIPTHCEWRLNERHYGALQGLNKAETTAIHGEDQVHIWRRSFDIPPEPLKDGDTRTSYRDPAYQSLDAAQVPLTESLKDTVARVMPLWNESIAPDILAGKQILIAAHGNSLRALIKELEGIGDDEIANLNIPTGQPIVYELDKDLKPIRHYYLGDAKEIEAATKAVAMQASTKV